MLGILALACIVGAIALDHWNVADFWPVLALLAAVAAWNGFWWQKRRRRGSGNQDRAPGMAQRE